MTRWMTEELIAEMLKKDEASFVATLVGVSRKRGKGVEPHSLVAYDPKLFPNAEAAVSKLEELTKRGVFVRRNVGRGAVKSKTVWIVDDLARRALALSVGARAFVGSLEPTE